MARGVERHGRFAVQGIGHRGAVALKAHPRADQPRGPGKHVFALFGQHDLALVDQLVEGVPDFLHGMPQP